MKRFAFPKMRILGRMVLVQVFALSSLDANVEAPGPAVSGSFSSIPSGSVINLTNEGDVDWVHWGLYTETSLDRKAGVVPQISDFTPVDAPTGFVFIYQFGDNANGYSWSDGTPTAAVTNTTTGVWAYGTPLIGSGFQLSAPADTGTRTLKVYAGAFKARGRLEAFLSDGSAGGYTNTSLFNMGNGPSAVYTLTYSAASPGQQLIVRWTLSTPSGPDGNVTLQAAALTASGANNPPFVALTNPVNNATFPVGGTITLEATATDLDGAVAKVEFFLGGNKLGEDLSSPFSFEWNNPPLGLHELSAQVTDDRGAVSSSRTVEIFVNGTGGSLAGSITLPPALPAAVNLTTEGTHDWIHWGLSANDPVDRKANVIPQISDFAKIGPSEVKRYGNNYTAFSWNDGTPTLTAAGTATGVFTYGLNEGFEINVPADTSVRTLKVYAGLYGAQGNFQAWLSDFSVPAYTDTTLSNGGDGYAVYRIDYAAASAGQTLHVRYRSINLFDQDFGNVTLQAATLVVNIPPTVSLIDLTNGQSFVAPANLTLSATASDGDGSVTNVEFFNGATSLGNDTTDPYSISWNNVGAGTYTLTVQATDDHGAVTTSTAVTISVTNNPVQAVTLLNPTWDGAAFIFSFASQPGRPYEAQTTDALGSGEWQLLTTLTGDGSILSVTNINPSPAQRFYRVESK